MTSEQVLLNFANERMYGEDDTGYVIIENRCLFVGGDLLALYSRAKMVYVNIDHADTNLRRKLLCFLPASDVMRVTDEVICDCYHKLK